MKQKFLLLTFLLPLPVLSSSLSCSLSLGGVLQPSTLSPYSCSSVSENWVTSTAEYGYLHSSGESYTSGLAAISSFEDTMTISGSGYVAFNILDTCPQASGSCQMSLDGFGKGTPLGHWWFLPFEDGVPFNFGATLINWDYPNPFPPALLGATLRIKQIAVTRGIQVMDFSSPQNYAMPVSYSVESGASYNFINGVAIPEPGTFWLLGFFLLILLLPRLWRICH